MTPPKPIVVAVVGNPSRLPAGFDPAVWFRVPPRGYTLNLLPVSAETRAEEILADLAHAHTDVVVFVGLGAAEAVLAARWSGMRVVLVVPAEELRQGLGDWRDAAAAAPFHAHLVVAVGADAPVRLVTDDGLEWIATYVASDFRQLDLGHVLAVAGKVEDPVPPPPRTGSTFRHLAAELELRRHFVEGRPAEEAAAVRARCLEWCRRSRREAFEVATPTGGPPHGGGRPRVLFVSHDLSKTGAPTALLWALRGMAALDLSFEPWVLGIGDGPMEDLFKEQVGAAHFRKAHFRDASPHYRDILRAFDEVDPDAVFLNASPIYAYAPLLRWKGIPTLWWFHDGINVARRDGHLFTKRALEAFHDYALACADRVLTASHDTVEQIELFCPQIAGNVGMVPYGFDVDAILSEGVRLRGDREALRAEFGIPPDGVLFACVGSLERRKNQKRLVVAFQELLRSLPEAERQKHHLAIVGRLDPDNEGPHNFHAEIVKAIEAGFAAQIHITGPRPSGFPIMVAADCHVLVSTNECSPLVNIECMLLETFVISSRVHGIPEVVLDGIRGRLVDPEDVADIEGALRWFIETKHHRPGALDAMKARAKEYAVPHHGFVSTGRIVRDEVQRVLDRGRGGAQRLSGAAANEFLEAELMLRWSHVKHDILNTCYPVRGHCHHLYDPQVPPPRASGRLTPAPIGARPR